MVEGDPKRTEELNWPSPAQIRAARALLNLSQDDLAKRANIERRSLMRIESQDDPTYGPRRVQTVEAVRLALEAAGIEFLPPTSTSGEGLRRRISALAST